MRRILLPEVLVLLILLVGCVSSDPAEPAVSSGESHGPEPIAVTHWTGKTELFAEYPPLVAGKTSRFAVHLTTLDDFKPVRSGRVTITLRSSSGEVQSFSADGPSRPGIFGVDVRPGSSGEVMMSIALEDRAPKDLHELGQVPVAASESKLVQAAEAEEEGGISFLKEQQWTLDFGTAQVQERTVRESLTAPGEVRPISGGEALVAASVSGRLEAGTTVPRVGAVVTKGDVVARLFPRVENPADRTGLELAVSEAETALSLATKETARAERLVNAGAVPSRRLEEAKAAQATAEARLSAARERLTKYESDRSAGSSAGEGPAFALRAPITGVVTELGAVPGAYVEQGATICRIMAVDPVYLVASIHEADIAKARTATGGEAVAPGFAQALPLGRLVSVGRMVDPSSRTLPLTYQVANRQGLLAIGQAVSVRLYTTGSRKALTIPQSAVVDDAGTPVVFVQTAGETFERRGVKLGIRDGDHVEVLEGVQAGERLASRGAYLVRLAALSTQIPAHGHVH
ncbi:MAG: efflux RND transporter periplasmic adaptor subunit [Acidobacteria bacterium]|nr:MAG: efflux RND transporter periplasmic adaptor subunit [Acidobacteriota bacterium]